jgi:3-oxoacyl-[acyl-carrier protein] reductase
VGRTFLITGTRKGIGKFLAEHYLKSGDTVVGCSRRPGSISHEKYFHYELDVAQEKPVVAMIKEVKKRHNRIDVLLNNAGIASMNHLMLTPLKTFEGIFRTNMAGVFLFTREVAKIMSKQKFGRIVNFSTVAVPLRLEGEAAYGASKAAVVNFTEVAARELAALGITVNAVGPTPLETDLIKNVPRDKIDNLLQKQAIKRYATFEDIVNVVDFFINERSGFITGQVIYLGGVCGP